MKKYMILILMSVGFFVRASQEIIQDNAQGGVIAQEISVGLRDDQAVEIAVLAKEPVEVQNQLEKTFAIIKPDAVAAGHTGQIIDLIEKNGFEIVRMQKKMLTLELAMDFYAAHQEKPFYNDLIAYMSSGPIVILELSKDSAIADWRALIGTTDPAVSGVGTIRKMFGTSKTHNAVHGSDSKEAARQEVQIMFNH